MIGGEDDDLEALIEECRTQVDTPPLMTGRTRGPTPERDSQIQGTSQEGSRLETPSNSSQEQNHLTSSLAKFIEHTGKLVEALSNKDERSREGKRRLKEEVNLYPQDPILLSDPAYKLEDDGQDVLDLALRQKLRPINACPKTYWTKGSFERVERPVRGAALFLSHLIPGYVNEATICKFHDRCAFLEIKNFLSKNAGVARDNKQVAKVAKSDQDEFSMGISTVWEPANYVWEVMEAGLNYIEFMVRGYSYSGLAMLRCLHEARYFCGVASNPKQQRVLLEHFFNECFQVLLCIQNLYFGQGYLQCRRILTEQLLLG